MQLFVLSQNGLEMQTQTETSNKCISVVPEWAGDAACISHPLRFLHKKTKDYADAVKQAKKYQEGESMSDKVKDGDFEFNELDKEAADGGGFRHRTRRESSEGGQIFMGGCCAGNCSVGYVGMVVFGFLFRVWLV